MGERKRRREAIKKESMEALGVETPGGRIQVRWDNDAAVTSFGQMAFFIEFLNLSGLLSDWIDTSPLTYVLLHQKAAA